MELTRSRGSSVWSRQEAKLGDNLLSYLVMPPLSTPYGAVAAYRSISRQPYKVYWKILQHLQHNARRGHCTWRVHPLVQPPTVLHNSSIDNQHDPRRSSWTYDASGPAPLPTLALLVVAGLCPA